MQHCLDHKIHRPLRGNKNGVLAADRQAALAGLGVDEKGRSWLRPDLAEARLKRNRPRPITVPDVDSVLKAVAHPHRRQMLMLVRASEMTVKEIAAHCDMTPQSAGSLLKTIARAGLLDTRRDGRRRVYTFRPEGLDTVKEVIAELTSRDVDIRTAMTTKAP